MGTSLWHLTGQVYCELLSAPDNVNETTILDESAFSSILKKNNKGLFSAYKAASVSDRATIRSLIGQLHPFNLNEFVERHKLKTDLPEILNLGIPSDYIYNLCEKYNPSYIQNQIRYSYSPLGLENAIAKGKAERLDESKVLLGLCLFPIDKTTQNITLVESARYKEPSAFEALLKELVDAIDDLEKGIGASEQEISLIKKDSRTIVKIAAEARELELQKQNQDIKSQRDIIFAAQQEVKRLQRDANSAVKKVDAQLTSWLEYFKRKLEAGNRVAEIDAPTKKIYETYYNFLYFLSINGKSLEASIRKQLQDDFNVLFSGTLRKGILPEKDELIRLIEDTVISDRWGFIRSSFANQQQKKGVNKQELLAQRQTKVASEVSSMLKVNYDKWVNEYVTVKEFNLSDSFPHLSIDFPFDLKKDVLEPLVKSIPSSRDGDAESELVGANNDDLINADNFIEMDPPSDDNSVIGTVSVNKESIPDPSVVFSIVATSKDGYVSYNTGADYKDLAAKHIVQYLSEDWAIYPTGRKAKTGILVHLQGSKEKPKELAITNYRLFSQLGNFSTIDLEAGQVLDDFHFKYKQGRYDEVDDTEDVLFVGSVPNALEVSVLNEDVGKFFKSIKKHLVTASETASDFYSQSVYQIWRGYWSALAGLARIGGFKVIRDSKVEKWEGSFIAKRSVSDLVRYIAKSRNKLPEKISEIKRANETRSINIGDDVEFMFCDLTFDRVCVRVVTTTETKLIGGKAEQEVSYYLLKYQDVNILLNITADQAIQKVAEKYKVLFESRQLQQNLFEQENEDPNLANDKERSAVSNPKAEVPEKPTEMVPTSPEERGEEGAPGTIQLPDGHAITKEQAGQIAAQILRKTADQIEQPTNADQQTIPPKKEEVEEEDDKSEDEDDDKEEQETENDDDKEDEEDDKEDEEDDKDEEEDDDDDDEKEEKKAVPPVQEESIIRNNLQRFLSYQNESYNGAYVCPELSESTKDELRALGYNLSNGISEAAADEVLSVEDHPLVETFSKNYEVVCSLSRGDMRTAFQYASNLRESMAYSLDHVALAVAQLNNFTPIQISENSEELIDSLYYVALNEGGIPPTEPFDPKEQETEGEFIEGSAPSGNIPPEERNATTTKKVPTEPHDPGEQEVKGEFKAKDGSPKVQAVVQVEGYYDGYNQFVPLDEETQYAKEKKKLRQWYTSARENLKIKENAERENFYQRASQLNIQLNKKYERDRKKVEEQYRNKLKDLRRKYGVKVQECLEENTRYYPDIILEKETVANFPGDKDQEERNKDDKIDVKAPDELKVPKKVPMPPKGATNVEESLLFGINKVLATARIESIKSLDENIDGIKDTILSDEPAMAFLTANDIGGLFNRVKVICPDCMDDEITAAISELQSDGGIATVSGEVVSTALDTPIPPEVSEEGILDKNDVSDYPHYADETPIDTPVYVDTVAGMTKIPENMPYESVLVHRGKSTCTILSEGKEIVTSIKNTRLLPPGADFTTCLRRISLGESLEVVARERLYSRVRATPIKNVPIRKLEEERDFLVVYGPSQVVQESEDFGGYSVDGIGFIPTKGLNSSMLSECVAYFENKASSIAYTYATTRKNPAMSLCEQMEVPSGQEEDVAAASFVDGMETLQSAMKSLIDFQSNIGKITSLLSMTDKGKGTEKNIAKVSDRIKKCVADLKEISKEYSDVHSGFEKEFPDSNPENVRRPEEAPAPASKEEPAVEDPKTEEAPAKKEESPAEQKNESIVQNIMADPYLMECIHQGQVSGFLKATSNFGLSNQELTNLYIEIRDKNV